MMDGQCCLRAWLLPPVSPQIRAAPRGGSGRSERCPRHPAPTSQHPKTHPLAPKPAQPVGCCPPSCSVRTPSSSSSSAPSHPAATSGQGTVLGRGQGWSLVVTVSRQPLLPSLASSPLSLVARGCRRTPVPAVTPVSPTSPCCRLRAGNRDPHIWGAPQPPLHCRALWGSRAMAEAQASPAVAPGETEARSRAAEVPRLGAPTSGLAKQKAGARSVEGADLRGLPRGPCPCPHRQWQKGPHCTDVTA